MIDKTSIIKTLQLESMTHSDQMEVLDSIEKTIKESKVRQKEQLQTNVDFVVHALKGIKQDLEERFSRLDNKLVGKVDNILSGKDGLPGKDGMPGRDGRAGRDGAQGSQGEKGADGTDGVGVSNAKVDIDGELVITLTDGRIIEAGKVFTKAVAEKIRVFSNMDNRIPELVGQSGKILSNDGVNVIWTYNVPITIKDEGTSITTAVKSINFVGATVTATESNEDVTVNVSAGTGTVTSVAATAGTGISITGSPITTTGTLNITNTAPDQTVVLTASTGISTSGTYPNFTITNSAPDQTVALTAGTGISTSGTYPNFTITNSAPDQTVALTGAGTTSVTGTYPNFTITSNDSATGTVTSVAATVPSFLSVTGSPITTSGTLAITLSGTALPVVNGGTGVTTSTGSGNVVLSTSPSLTTPVLGTPTSGTLSNCTVDGTDAVGFRNVPVNSQSAAYTLVLADSGKTILHPSGDANARTFTIPSNASVAYPIGTVVTFINMTSQVVTIAINTDTMNLSPAGTTGSRSLAQYGSATALKIASTNWLISGSGLT
jgi:hypothetical protein